MPIHTEEVKIPAADGGAFMAYIARPEGVDKAPAIIVIQEIFGINAEIRKKCDDYAKQGFLAISPDLFWRIEPGLQLNDHVEEELEKAFELFGKFDVEKGMQDLKTTYGYIAHHDKCNKKVGCVGYCLGGKLAYLMAVQTDINASVSYYGVGIEDMLDKQDRIEDPLLLHIAEEDEFVSKPAQQQIKKALEDHPHITVHSYAGVNHAFARDQGIHYKEDAAKLANERTAAFFRTYLA